MLWHKTRCLQPGLRRALRWSSTAEDILYPLNGRVVSFATDEATMERVGLRSGDRVRSYAGNRVGQLGVVLGVRNNALFVKWGDEAAVQGHAFADLPRLDLRYIDAVGIEGVDRKAHKEGDHYAQPLFTKEQIEDNARVSIALDDASVQHLVNEKPCGEVCHRCKERSDWQCIENAVDDIGVLQHVRARLLRLLRLQSDVHAPLTSRAAIDRAVQQAMETGAREGGEQRPGDVFTNLIQQRMGDFDALLPVRVKGMPYNVPVALVVREKRYTLKDARWAQLLPNAAAATGTLKHVAASHAVPDLGLSFSDTARRLMDAMRESIQIDDIVAAAELPEEAAQRLAAVLALNEGGFDAVTSLNKALDESTDPDRVRALANVLAVRADALATCVTAAVDGHPGLTVTLPKLALQSVEDLRMRISDAPWAPSVLEGIAGFEGDDDTKKDILGAEGEIIVEKVITPPSINVHEISSTLLHRLSIFEGRHREPDIPQADVFCPEGEYKYLDRACAVELYAGKKDPPAMFCARGLDEYKSNAWHQPFNMVNDHGLEEFAPWKTRRVAYHRRRVHQPHAFPGAAMR